LVYAVPIQNMKHLKQRIRTACEEIRRDSIIAATNGNLLRSAELCLQDNSNTYCNYVISLNLLYNFVFYCTLLLCYDFW
ncbi:hypothetical protein ALC57_14117, partial [Trachymyrmex cornetzi]